MHVSAPALLYWSAAHALHSALPGVAPNVPAAQGLQVALDCERVPTGQGRHAELEGEGMPEPAGHVAPHAAAPTPLTLEAAHAVQFWEPGALKVPAAQAVQALTLVAPWEGCCVPAGQARQ